MNTKYIPKLLDSAARIEESTFPSGSFMGYIGKGYTYGLTAVSVTGIVMGLFLILFIKDYTVGSIFTVLGLAATLLLPTYFSYRCYVDNTALKIEYYILCFKRTQTIMWKDIKYKSTRVSKDGSLLSIHFYNQQKKKTISFDSSIVGFSRITRMAKRKTIAKK